ncbi:hypothetical protein CAEBREN_21556 [Caenorhabditis brenneri]|uniref:Uncharacterized protein n=1 Tax=Caenorhabditis brenneri TaxID=135651 RepID=G0P7T3_CAEBE|nr:hypothetical protein CAEBREN_21556 [Caenorhabditis brenneri]
MDAMHEIFKSNRKLHQDLLQKAPRRLSQAGKMFDQCIDIHEFPLQSPYSLLFMKK